MTKTSKKVRIARTVWILSWVSLLTDVASEMLYPITPIYLSGIGVSIAGIALIEGVAEALAGVTKSFFGFLGDKAGRPERFVRLGYGLSAITKPLIGFTASPLAILSLRLGDRFGKGIRSTPRDTILTQYSEPETRGRIFGFHRSMDSFGAAIGPLIALLLIAAFSWGSSLQNIYFVSAIPGILALGLTWLVHSKQAAQKIHERPVALFKEYLSIFKLSTYSSSFRWLIGGQILVALFNSSDIFLLLRAREIFGGGYVLGSITIDPAIGVIGVYILYNISYSLLSHPMGILADKVGYQRTFGASLCIFVGVYTVLAQTHSPLVLVLAMIAYGAFAAGNDAVSKAWTTTTLDQKIMGRGIGVSSSLQSLTFLGASILSGVLWQLYGSAIALSASAVGMLLPIIYFEVAKVRLSKPSTQ